MTEDQMVGWDHQLNGHEFEQAPGDGKGQGRILKGVLQSMVLQTVGHYCVTEQQQQCVPKAPLYHHQSYMLYFCTVHELCESCFGRMTT